MPEGEVQAAPAPSPTPTPSEGLSQEAAKPDAITPPSDPVVSPQPPEDGVQSGDDVDLGGLRTLLDKTGEEAQERGLKAAQLRLHPLLQQSATNSGETAKQAKAMRHDLRDLLSAEQGAINKDDLNSFFERNEDAIGILGRDQSAFGYVSGATGLIREMVKRSGIDPGTIELDVEYFLKDTSGEPAFIDDFITAVTKAKVTEAVAEAETRWTKQADVREKASAKAREAQGATNPADVTGTAGTGGANIRNMEGARAAHAKGEITNAQMRDYKRRFAVAQ